MEGLQAQHKELLHVQLASVREELHSQANTVALNGHVGAMGLGAGPAQSQAELDVEVEGSIDGALTGLEMINIQLQPEQSELRRQLVEFGQIQTETLPVLDSPSSDAVLTVAQDLEVKQDVPLVSRKRGSERDCGGTSETKVPRAS